MLAVDAVGELEPTYEVAACDLSADDRCSGWPTVATALAATSTQATSITLPTSLALAAIEADPLRGFAGIRVKLAISGKVAGVELSATKTLILTSSQPGYLPNSGFELHALALHRRSRAHHTQLSIPLEPDDQVIEPERRFNIDRLDAYELTPIVGPDASGSPAVEEYDTTDLLGRQVRLREILTFSFFLGSRPDDRFDWPDDYLSAFLPYFDKDTSQLGGVDSRTPTVTLVSPEGGTGPAWVVGRDSRGAVAWARFFYKTVDATLPGTPHFFKNHRCTLQQ